jgi:hypothetical protein
MKPDCHACSHHAFLDGGMSLCLSDDAKPDFLPLSKGGKRWGLWPLSYNPTWLVCCDGFEPLDETPLMEPSDEFR